MQATSASPDRPVQRPPTPSSPKRRPWRLVAVLVLVALVAAGVVWGTAFVGTYRPIELGHATFSTAPFAHDLGPHTSPQGDDFEDWGIECHIGQPTHFGFTIENTGPIGVTVTSLVAGQHPDFILQLVDPRIGPGTGSSNDIFNGPLAPFRPFSLAPGHERRIQMSLVMRNCNIGIMFIGSTQIAFRVFGVTRHQTLFFPYTLYVSKTGLRTA